MDIIVLHFLWKYRVCCCCFVFFPIIVTWWKPLIFFFFQPWESWSFRLWSEWGYALYLSYLMKLQYAWPFIHLLLGLCLGMWPPLICILEMIGRQILYPELFGLGFGRWSCFRPGHGNYLAQGSCRFHTPTPVYSWATAFFPPKPGKLSWASSSPTCLGNQWPGPWCEDLGTHSWSFHWADRVKGCKWMAEAFIYRNKCV